MAADIALFLFSLVLAALIGFAAHRASLRTVLAVTEVLSTRRAHMFLSFIKTVLWIMAITMPLIWLMPMGSPRFHGWQLSWAAVAGGLLIGIGAALNGGCAVSTLTKLGAGRLRMFLTLATFCLGLWVYASLAKSAVVPLRTPAATPYGTPQFWTVVLLAGLGLWALWEIVRLWRTREGGLSWRELVLSKRYRLSAAAALLGVSNGVLYALHGPWAYTNAAQREVERAVGLGGESAGRLWLLFVALLAGMTLSAWQRGSFRLEWRPSPVWVRNLAGGLLMGLGAGLAIGSNDALLLHGLPGLSPHALPSYLALIAGIMIVLLVEKWLQGRLSKVDCHGDTCRTMVDA